MKIEINKNSGFCFGVIEAIKKAETILAEKGELYCLGDIVHNNVEVERLQKLGLVTLGRDEFFTMENCTVLLRAHGEPPETYEYARLHNIEIIDATCPVVLKLQKRVKKGYDELNNIGQVVIYGKRGHAEVNGLVGQTGGNAVVIEQLDEVEQLDLSIPTLVYSQTTQPLEGFEALVERMKDLGGDNVKTFDTICRQVANRIPKFQVFAKEYDRVVFVGGKKSSNAKVLFEICRAENPNTVFVSSVDELEETMVRNIHSVGICGATSTPMHLMEAVANRLQEFAKEQIS